MRFVFYLCHTHKNRLQLLLLLQEQTITTVFTCLFYLTADVHPQSTPRRILRVFSLVSKFHRNYFACNFQVILFWALIHGVPVLSSTLDPKCKKNCTLPFWGVLFSCWFLQFSLQFLPPTRQVVLPQRQNTLYFSERGHFPFVWMCGKMSNVAVSSRFSSLLEGEKEKLIDSVIRTIQKYLPTFGLTLWAISHRRREERWIFPLLFVSCACAKSIHVPEIWGYVYWEFDVSCQV